MPRFVNPKIRALKEKPKVGLSLSIAPITYSEISPVHLLRSRTQQ